MTAGRAGASPHGVGAPGAEADLSKLMAIKEFRGALSHAINREQIKESVFLGLGEASPSATATARA